VCARAVSREMPSDPLEEDARKLACSCIPRNSNREGKGRSARLPFGIPWFRFFARKF